MKLIFVDIDGVLNNTQRQSNGYAGIRPECVANFNKILNEIPDLQVVISSSWRYMTPTSMNLTGFEYMLLVCGVNCNGRLFGFTRRDGDESDTRGKQIKDFLAEHPCEKYVAIDDVPEGFDDEGIKYVKTNHYTGLTEQDANAIIQYFNEK